ncbi:hypothetical protein AZE42_06498 [Rhizopogon vesiculosus]|uniref:Uncharacterized protein n=1 Tax=Rhizopogon vesiculosus TaxID=180088 RepID=A0A1J8QKU9_9AGAM|nr:hypothetical protein AZE42_06498 [Rhizopogon vesiculosus]
MFVEWVSYHWVFWFFAIVAAPVALAGVFLIPPPQVAETADSLEPTAAKWKSVRNGTPLTTESLYIKAYLSLPYTSELTPSLIPHDRTIPL